MSDDKKARDRLERMDDFVLHDLSSISDEELLKEAIEDGVDLEEVGRAGLAALDRAQLVIGRRRMAAIRRDMEMDSRKPPMRPVRGASQAGLRSILARNREAANKLTMAARNETGSLDDDAEGILADFMELGAIPGEGEGEA
ncbi:hypothetical protein SSBR45G_46550 [Bradyrhizobium sp. SSBR45G]|uniref:hypothetical protein n=1 Tax=unclassified Bradyrhizobium TaxID=2631580 RepID=UPI002342B37F|nr:MULTISPECIES: hypothetical protein [unclassified Bradyrhizobium]GLH79746.1 hypothetical protein SSBR45G_46550 [Bradyrhizobium sp. SSBR45G]GLH87136.1 hypothetical protein SSBR45R_45960 [Bradyrhizobium sp. SSBR45R]